MRASIREQMNRYPIFSCVNSDYIDESDLFKDEEIKKSKVKAPFQRKHQTITSIYDRINMNNSNDPLYPQKNNNSSNKNSNVTTARNSRPQIPLQPSASNTISKFVGELAKSLARDDQTSTDTNDSNRNQKISLLKRIIDHYNMKSSEKKYYSNLIKSYGLRIEAMTSTEIAVKKNLHPRESKNMINVQIDNSQVNFSGIINLNDRKKVIRASNSFILSKKNIKQSRKYITTNDKKRSNASKNGNFLHTSQKFNEDKRKKQTDASKFIQKKPIKLNTSANSVEGKIHKYRNFLFLINLSNGFYRDLEIQKYETTLKFYVGKGNNRNLIRSLMKKRFWFEQTENILQANFVWTQLKINSFFEKQMCGVRKDQEEEVETDLLFTHPDIEQQKEVKQFENERKIESSNLEKNINKFRKIEKNGTNNKLLKNIGKPSDSGPADPHLKILTKTDLMCYRSIEESVCFKNNPSFLDKIKAHPFINSLDQFKPEFVQNHLPSNGLLGNKKAMYYNLKQFCRLKKKNLSDYVPLTFHIKKGLLDEQYKKVAGLFVEKKKLKKSNYWIMKPGEFSNRGQGISCTNKLEDIRKRLRDCDSKKSRKGMGKKEQPSLIVQEYISNPMLYNFRKFDIRMFMMVTINNGKVKGYWYQEGYIRTSSYVWSLGQIDDKYVHLTNDAIQKNCEEYGLYEAGNKLSFSELQRYLSTLPRNGRNLNFFEVAYPRMKTIAADLIKSTFLNLDKRRLRDNFQIYGLDFMIDESLKAWLIEVNTNPCLELSCPLLQRIIPNMVENSLRISLDPHFPPPSTVNQNYKYSIPENALHYNKFQLIFDEDQQGIPLRKLYRQMKVMQEVQEWEEDKQEFEEQGEILQLDTEKNQ